jgi:RNA polymerase sigma factor (sigma-70 family)
MRRWIWCARAKTSATCRWTSWNRCWPTRHRRPDRVHGSGEIREWLRGAMARLNPRIAQMFVLRFFEGKENPEIARLLNTTPGTVAVTLSRTRDRLEKEYRAYLGGVA